MPVAVQAWTATVSEARSESGLRIALRIHLAHPELFLAAEVLNATDLYGAYDGCQNQNNSTIRI